MKILVKNVKKYTYLANQYDGYKITATYWVTQK